MIHALAQLLYHVLGQVTLLLQCLSPPRKLSDQHIPMKSCSSSCHFIRGNLRKGKAIMSYSSQTLTFYHSRKNYVHRFFSYFPIILLSPSVWFKCFFPFIISQNSCGTTPCMNGGTCQSGFLPHGYRCLCAAGFTGLKCETGKIFERNWITPSEIQVILFSLWLFWLIFDQSFISMFWHLTKLRTCHLYLKSSRT